MWGEVHLPWCICTGQRKAFQDKIWVVRPYGNPVVYFFLRVTIIDAEMSLIWGEKRYEKDYPGWTSPKFCYSVQTPNGINIVSTGLMDDI